ncbi:MAG TPA: 3-dehydroquinate synthase, partial [Oscillospiraceae bacterium]|nr:3-dehydroquinate synthase [Oscillospiraceae bacterium]
MRSIRVKTGHSYDIHVGRGILSDCGALAARVKAPCRVFLLSDETVGSLYAGAVEASFRAAGYDVTGFFFPAGEESKNFSLLGTVLNHMAAAGLTRSDLLVALGGGVPGDLGGFAAAVYQRGIDFIQIPTTLLAAVDASVGGKTAVDLSAGKNLAGAFWQPSLVLCDCAVFGTLPQAVFSDGMAEVIKYGVILDKALFRLLGVRDIRDGIEDVVLRCCALKSAVVEEDERDNGRRQLLNFGHTVGHAIEKASGFRVSHGSAVAIGMVAMSRAAERNGAAEPGVARKIAALCGV